MHGRHEQVVQVVQDLLRMETISSRHLHRGRTLLTRQRPPVHLRKIVSHNPSFMRSPIFHQPNRQYFSFSMTPSRPGSRKTCQSVSTRFGSISQTYTRQR